MKNLTQTFSDLARLKQDSWECYPGFIALKSKQSLDPQAIYTRDQGWFYLLYVTVQKEESKIYISVYMDKETRIKRI
jgi:hypothetical protein